MKDNKIIFNIYSYSVLLMVAVIEVWGVMRIVFGKWALSTPNVTFFVKFVIILFGITAFVFFLSFKLQRMYRFVCSLCVSLLITFCLYIYLLMGVYV